MANPLTLLTATYSVGAKSDRSHAEDSEDRSVFTFQDALNDEVENSDKDETLVAGADRAEAQEHPVFETENDTNAAATSPSDDSISAQPLTGLRDPEFPSNDGNPSPQKKAETSAKPQRPAQPEPHLDVVSSAQAIPAVTQQPTATGSIESESKALLPDRSHSVAHKPDMNQSPLQQVQNFGWTPTAFVKPKPHIVKPDVQSLGDAGLPPTNKAAPHAVAVATAKTLPQLANPFLVSTEEIADTSSAAESDDLPVLKDINLGHTQRDIATTAVPHTARADTARAIAGQMAAVISLRPGTGGVEIALNPEELGRVSITLIGREDGLHLTISAERPETLDLMRRHISILSAEFEKLGYGGMSLDLGMSGDAPQHGDEFDSDYSLEASQEPQTPEQVAPALPTSPDTALDMRL